MLFKYFSIKEIQNFLKENNISVTKRFGQNFLINAGAVDTIVKNANLTENDTVIEIGCGLGSLTHKILESKCRLIGFEIDNAYIKLIKNQYKDYKNFSLIEGDFLKKSSSILENLNNQKIKILGNLPYNITSPILEKILVSDINYDLIIFMVQKEVGERIAANPGSKKYGSLSIFCQYFTTVKIIARLSPKSFFPQPKIDSVILLLKKRKDLIKTSNRELFFKTARSLFINRRKQIKNNLVLSPFLKNFSNESILKALENAEIDPKIRGEILSIKDIAKLSNELYKLL